VEEARDAVVARLRDGDGREETCVARYLAGCDGAHSTVRASANLAFPGGTYQHVFYVADVVAHGDAMDGELHVKLDDADFLGLFPMKGQGRARLVGNLPDEVVDRGERAGWDDVRGNVRERMAIDVDAVNWFSTYRVHHRVVDRFCKGRVFLLGDAAHVHSPVG